MNREELKEYVPHREPMLLIDEVEVDEQGVAHAQYRIKEDEFFLQGHFPDNPIVPGVILCEIMAQSCTMLVKDVIKGRTTLYSGLDNVRFKHIVRPRDVCKITARLVKRRGMLFFCQAELYVEEHLCCKGDLSFALVDR